METLIGGGAGGPAPADLVKDTDTANFGQDVIEASKQVPVIVDFWAPWCGPCKQLGPMIEKAVREMNGAVKLVKLNVDENQELAQQFRIQSIPAVFAFKDGRPVDGFVGALPESQIKQFIKKLAGDMGPSPAEQAMEAAEEALKNGNHDQAANLYAQVLQQDNSNIKAAAGLARCAVAAGRVDEAKKMLESLPPQLANHAEIEAVQNAIALHEQAQEAAGDVAPLQEKVDANPEDLQARYDLALALFAANKAEEAVNHLLEIVRRDKEWNEEAARDQLIKIFDTLGPTHPVTLKGRRGLSSILFS